MGLLGTEIDVEAFFTILTSEALKIVINSMNNVRPIQKSWEYPLEI